MTEDQDRRARPAPKLHTDNETEPESMYAFQSDSTRHTSSDAEDNDLTRMIRKAMIARGMITGRKP